MNCKMFVRRNQSQNKVAALQPPSLSQSNTMKNSLKSVLLASLTIALAVVGTSFAGADPPETQTRSSLSPLMQMKLEKSKSILEGLALEDYDAISRNANALRLLSLEAGWNVLQTEEYATQSQEFRRATDMISAAANEKDMGRAALGYVGLTVRCVECHSYMRKHKAELIKQNSP